jgi:multicomponent Na+:H+ antiporter subunit G
VVVIAAVALLGVLVIVPGPAAFVTVAVAIVLQLFTVPIAGYALGGAAHRSGAPLDASTHHNELPEQE